MEVMGLQELKEYTKQVEVENKHLKKALRRIAAIDSTNDFTDSIVDIAQQALIKEKIE